MLAQGTVEFRRAERDHANGRGMTSSPSARVVTLRGGPLDGLRRHVLRGARRAWFTEPLSDRRHQYQQDPDDPATWRPATEEENELTDNEVRELLDAFGRELRAEFRRELLELRAEVADLVGEEMRQRVDADIAAQRVLDARTERLV